VLAPNPAYRLPGRLARPAPPDLPGGAEPACPYRGLEPFGEQDSAYFFGRGHLAGELVRRLAERLPGGGPLAVVGPSGSGKSSLLRAGLLPAVDRGALAAAGSRTWPQRVMTPGSEPIAELAKVISALAGSGPATMSGVPAPQHSLRDELRADPLALAPAVRQALARRADGQDAADARLILVVDQFEQLFTACDDQDERRGFIQALRAASGPATASRSPTRRCCAPGPGCVSGSTRTGPGCWSASI
jgi:hypothetical protein